MAFTIQVEDIMPGAVAPGPGFQLGQVQSAARELVQTFHQRSGAMRHSKDQRCLAIFGCFRLLVPQDEESGGVPRHVLDSFRQDLQTVYLGGEGAGNGSDALFRVLLQCLGTSRRIVHCLRFPPVLADGPLTLGQGLGVGSHYPDVL